MPLASFNDIEYTASESGVGERVYRRCSTSGESESGGGSSDWAASSDDDDDGASSHAGGSSSTKPLSLCLTGPTGCGKSALVAACAKVRSIKHHVAIPYNERI